MYPRENSAPTVLVVDDQETLALVMCQVLASNGFRVLRAHSGAEALVLFRGAETQIDLLVTDYSMPGMTGVELSRECYGINGGMGVLYVSGSMPGDELRRDLDAGKRGFLAKPFRQSELLHSVKAVLAMEPVGTFTGENHGNGLDRLSPGRLSMEG